MKVCFYSPYFPDHFGGGERHLLDIATHLPENMQAVVAYPKPVGKDIVESNVRAKYENFYGVLLEKISFISSPIGTSASFLEKIFWTRQFSYLFAVSDGSLFFSLAKKNIAHLQIPFTSYPNGFINRLKLQFWQLNTNSEFTKGVIEKNWKVRVASVLQPMVASELFALKQKKEKMILHVGRFFTQLHSKRQDILVENFRQLLTKNPEFNNWKLELVGSVEDAEYVAKIKSVSAGLPISIRSNCSRAELLDIYARASVYWHATGFEVDELAEPEKVEHFGITTVEAMAAGAVPVVVAKGGQREVLGPELQTLSWESSEGCVEQTSKLLADPDQLEKYSVLASERAKLFGETRFTKQVAILFSHA
ncbi:MAG: glycosyltransferase family 4 protein [Candidatus Pacebacteria bacterium]|nr:glycosyltransferase family 4 protein [Candidatus Paceibacterota bacterium]